MALLKQTQLHCFMRVLYCSEKIRCKQRELVKKEDTLSIFKGTFS